MGERKGKQVQDGLDLGKLMRRGVFSSVLDLVVVVVV